MNSYIQVSGLKVDKSLHGFVEREALPGSGVASETFWSGLAAIIRDLAPVNRKPPCTSV